MTGSKIRKYYSFAGQTIAMREQDTSVSATWTLSYLLTDHLGSVVAVTNASGTLTSQQRYLPFGGERTDVPSPNPQSPTDFSYTGQRDLASGMGGLMDYKARFYSPMLGRFIQPDSFIPNAANSQAWNRYSYVGNRPVNFNDPTGYFACGDGETKECGTGKKQDPPKDPHPNWFSERKHKGKGGGGDDEESHHGKLLPVVDPSLERDNWPDYITVSGYIPVGVIVGFTFQVDWDYYNNWYVEGGFYGGAPGVSVVGGNLLQEERPTESDLEGFFKSGSAFGGGGLLK